MWAFDYGSSQWTQVQVEPIVNEEGEQENNAAQKDDVFVPEARSGHAAVSSNNKIYIFGGIKEIT